MHEYIICPECGNKLRKGSTFCMNCGAAIPANIEVIREETAEVSFEQGIEEEPTLGPVPEEEDFEHLPELDESVLPETIKPPQNQVALSPEEMGTIVEEALAWEVEEEPATNIEPVEKAVVPESVPEIPIEIESQPSEGLTWEDMDIPAVAHEVKEGMPFTEVEPPTVVSEIPAVSLEEVHQHLFPEEAAQESTREAVSHLFPDGRGTTTPDFIDVIVGKPEKIDVTGTMPELTPSSCPSCGGVLTGDGFEYPDYVFEAMAKARMEDGVEKLKQADHGGAIEAFEKAKKLYEKAGNEKMAQVATSKVDEGYEERAAHHYQQAEQHLKSGEFEWAVVQFRKARELYMLTTQSKMRSKCSERVRDAYSAWGKGLESEGDRLAKQDSVREALAKYQEAAEKYRLANETKKLKGLEKKIRNA